MTGRMATEFEKVVSEAISADPELANEVRSLLKSIIHQARITRRDGTPQMKASLMSKGIGAMISSVADQDGNSKMADLQRQLTEMREAIRTEFEM